MKRRQVVYTPDAATDLDTIYDFISETTGPAVATRYVGRIRNFCERLDIGAERGNRRDDIRPGLRVIGFERRISVALIVEEDRVVVLRLFYGGRDWNRVIR